MTPSRLSARPGVNFIDRTLPYGSHREEFNLREGPGSPSVIARGHGSSHPGARLSLRDPGPWTMCSWEFSSPSEISRVLVYVDFTLTIFLTFP